MLCARGARYQLDDNDATPVARDFLHRFLSDPSGRRNRSAPARAYQQGNIGLARFVIRAVAKYLHNDVGGTKYRGAIGKNLRALRGEIGIGITGFGSRAGLDGDFQTRFRKVPESRVDTNATRRSPGKISLGHSGPSHKIPSSSNSNSVMLCIGTPKRCRPLKRSHSILVAPIMSEKASFSRPFSHLSQGSPF